MPQTPTPYLNLAQISDDEEDWGDDYRDNMTKIDTAIQALAEGGTPVPSQVNMDYQGRVDDLPVYIGRAPIAAADNSPTWTVTRLYYDGERLLHTEVRTGLSWLNRETPLDPWPTT